MKTLRNLTIALLISSLFVAPISLAQSQYASPKAGAAIGPWLIHWVDGLGGLFDSLVDGLVDHAWSAASSFTTVGDGAEADEPEEQTTEDTAETVDTGDLDPMEVAPLPDPYG